MEELYEIVFTEQSEQDLDRIVDYLAQNWSGRVKIDFLAALSDKLATLSRTPLIFRASITEQGIRECIINRNTVLYYRIIENQVELLSFRSPRQG
jgi:addiction module RelE/StbE family toxin